MLNTLFGMKSKNSHEYAKHFIDQIIRKFFRARDDKEIGYLKTRPDDEIMNIEPMKLRETLTDQHYSQMFFVVGHIAIKMLTFIESLESNLKASLNASFNKKE